MSAQREATVDFPQPIGFKVECEERSRRRETLLLIKMRLPRIDEQDGFRIEAMLAFPNAKVDCTPAYLEYHVAYAMSVDGHWLVDKYQRNTPELPMKNSQCV
jgi:hypothetical protein